MLPTGPSGDTVAASSGQGNTRRRAAVGHEQAEQDPADAVGPAEHLSALSPRPPMATTSSEVNTHTSANE